MFGLINIKKYQERLFIQDFGGFQTRNFSSIKLAQQLLSEVKKDVEFNIYTEDKPKYNINGIRTFSYSTINEDYSNTCPDFIFNHWKEARIDDYEQHCVMLNECGKINYSENKIGWIGSFSCLARKQLYNYYKNNTNIFEMHVTNLTLNLDGVVQSDNFMTMDEQVKKWKYLLDIEGNGYSGRLKLLMWSGRPVFIIDRPYKEYFYQFMEPWKHYIPVKRNLSDLSENYNIIEKDHSLYKHISENAVKFSKEYLTKKFALDYWKNLI